MTSSQFMELSIADREEILLKHGILQNNEFDYGRYKVKVYELYGYLVSVFYDLKINKIWKIILVPDEKTEAKKLFDKINNN